MYCYLLFNMLLYFDTSQLQGENDESKKIEFNSYYSN